MSSISSADLKKIFKLLFVLLVILIAGFFIHTYLVPDTPITPVGPKITQNEPLNITPLILVIVIAVPIILIFIVPTVLSNRRYKNKKKGKSKTLQEILDEWDRGFD